mgnify:CR=1 FL=1
MPNTEHHSALKFITCGSVDDGKSTLIGRLLVDSKAVLQDHLAGVQRSGETDLALLTDGLSAERAQRQTQGARGGVAAADPHRLHLETRHQDAQGPRRAHLRHHVPERATGRVLPERHPDPG